MGIDVRDKVPSPHTAPDAIVPAGDLQAKAAALTVRSVLVGLMAGMILAAVGYLNDSYFNLTLMIGNHFPVSVYGFVLLLVLIANPLLGLLRKSWRFSAGELTVILVLMLAAGAGSNGYLRTLTPALAMPAQMQDKNLSWQKTNVVGYLPPGVIVNDGKKDDRVIGRFASGVLSSEAPKTVPQALDFVRNGIPWDAWKAPLATWLPIIGLILLAGLCLVLVVQPQWDRVERMPFPIARFAQAMITGRTETRLRWEQDEKPAPSIYRTSGFWIMLAIPFCIHLVNGIYTWNHDFIRVPLNLPLYYPILQKLPSIANSPWAYFILDLKIYFTVIGLTFFLSRDVSLSIGIEPFLYLIVSLLLLNSGINIDDGPGIGTYNSFFSYGAFLGIGVALIYSGRRYYSQLFLRSLGLRRAAAGLTEGVWAARILILSCMALTVIFTRLGIAWPFAILTVLTIMLLYLVIARINAESGLFFFYPVFFPSTVVAGLFGFYALGPQMLLLIAMISTVIMASDVRTPLAPILQNGMALCHTYKVPTGRVARWAVIMILVSFPVALTVALFINYDKGIFAQKDAWARDDAPSVAFDTTARAAETLTLGGELKGSLALSDMGRLANIRPLNQVLPLVAAGLFLILALTFLRHRFPKWPIHPILLLTWGSFPLVEFGFSFLLGWMIRSAVVKFAGERASHKAKPLMIGLVAGEMLAAIFWMLLGAGYFAITHTPPPQYSVFPR